jgi:hypothetical protein
VGVNACAGSSAPAGLAEPVATAAE